MFSRLIWGIWRAEKKKSCCTYLHGVRKVWNYPPSWGTAFKIRILCGCAAVFPQKKNWHPRKKAAIFHFPEQHRRSSHLLTEGASVTYYSRCVCILSPRRSDAPSRRKRNKTAYNNPCARISGCLALSLLLVSVVISQSQVWVPFFLNPPRTDWGWGDRSQTPPPSFLPPLCCSEKNTEPCAAFNAAS